MTSISMKELFKALESLQPSELVLDVRTPEEYREGHIPGAKNIPFDEVGQHQAEIGKYQKIYIHCQAGKRAQIAYQSLEKAGVQNLIVVPNSGMGEWIQLGYPTKKGSTP